MDGGGGVAYVDAAQPRAKMPCACQAYPTPRVPRARHPTTGALQQRTCGPLYWKWQKEMQQVDWTSTSFAVARTEEISVRAELPLLSPVAKDMRGIVQVRREVLGDQLGGACDVSVDHEAHQDAPGVAKAVLSHKPQDTLSNVLPGKALGIIVLAAADALALQPQVGIIAKAIDDFNVNEAYDGFLVFRRYTDFRLDPHPG